MNRPIKKLLKGIALFTLFQLYEKYVGTDGLHKIIKAVQAFFSFLPDALALIIGDLTGLIISLMAVYAAVSGLFRICTFHMHIPTYEQ